MAKIKYLSHYDEPSTTYNRSISSLAAVNKQDYIFKVLSQLNVETTVISACGSCGKIANPASEKQIYPNIRLKLLPTMGCNKKLSRIVAELLFRLRLMYSILKEVKNGDTLFVYHSLYLINYLNILKKIRKINLVIDVEEIYGDVLQSKKVVKKELEFFKKADGYLFATELLERKINVENKPYAVVYGTYNVEEDLISTFNDEKIHVVYAGTLDIRKGGAITAVGISEFLNDKYHIHILGFGTNEDKEHLCKEIDRISKFSNCCVTYDGCLSGDKYIEFLQKCQIGLSTQDPNAAFNETSFPSKILSYMANGLRVVSARINAVEESEIGKYVYYYDKQSSLDIAEAILNVDFNTEYDSKKLVSDLHQKFSKNIISLIENFI